MIDEFFLYGSIKSLIVSIHLGCSRVGMVVCLVEVTNMLVELFLKLTSIVCEYLMYLERKELLKSLKEFFCCD